METKLIKLIHRMWIELAKYNREAAIKFMDEGIEILNEGMENLKEPSLNHK